MVFTCDNCPEAASVHCFVHKQSLCANCDGMCVIRATFIRLLALYLHVTAPWSDPTCH